MQQQDGGRLSSHPSDNCSETSCWLVGVAVVWHLVVNESWDESSRSNEASCRSPHDTNQTKKRAQTLSSCVIRKQSWAEVSRIRPAACRSGTRWGLTSKRKDSSDLWPVTGSSASLISRWRNRSFSLWTISGNTHGNWIYNTTTERC